MQVNTGGTCECKLCVCGAQCISTRIFNHESGIFRDRRHLSSIVTSFSSLWPFFSSSVPLFCVLELVSSCVCVDFFFSCFPHSLLFFFVVAIVVVVGGFAELFA